MGFSRIFFTSLRIYFVAFQVQKQIQTSEILVLRSNLILKTLITLLLNLSINFPRNLLYDFKEWEKPK